MPHSVKPNTAHILGWRICALGMGTVTLQKASGEVALIPASAPRPLRLTHEFLVELASSDISDVAHPSEDEEWSDDVPQALPSAAALMEERDKLLTEVFNLKRRVMQLEQEANKAPERFKFLAKRKPA